MLAHTTLPVPDSQKRDLTVTPGSSTGLFNSSLLAEVISQVQSSSQVSSNLALSRAFRRGRSTPSSSSPLTGPRLPSFSRGRQSTKRSSSSSRSGGRKRFRGGKGGLLLPVLRVSGSRSHHLFGPFLAAVCPSIGRPGGTGWWRCCGSAIVCPSSVTLHYPVLRSLCLLTAPLPSRVLLWRRSP